MSANPNRDDAFCRAFEARERRRLYWGRQCSWCGWTANGLTIERADGECRAHERRSHPGIDEYRKKLPTLSEMRDELHADHDCAAGPCRCRCNCDVTNAGCSVLFGPYCSVCIVRANRGDEEHGPKREEAMA